MKRPVTYWMCWSTSDIIKWSFYLSHVSGVDDSLMSSWELELVEFLKPRIDLWNTRNSSFTQRVTFGCEAGKKTSLWTSAKQRAGSVQNSLWFEFLILLVIQAGAAENISPWHHVCTLRSTLIRKIHQTCVRSRVWIFLSISAHLRPRGAAGVFSQLVIEPDPLAQLTLTHNICSAVLGLWMARLQRWGRPRRRRPQPSITGASWSGRSRGDETRRHDGAFSCNCSFKTAAKQLLKSLESRLLSVPLACSGTLSKNVVHFHLMM